MERVSVRGYSLMATVLLVASLAGCSGDRGRTAVDFSNVTDVQEGSGSEFELHVNVLGLDDLTRPLNDAFVGIVEGDQPLAKARTTPDGEAVVFIKKDQVVRVVAQANGWTTEDSSLIGIEEDVDDSSGTLGVCAPFTPCVVVDFEESPGYRLEGDVGTVTMILFRSPVTQTFQIPVGPHANGRVVAPPDNRAWFPATKPLSEESAYHQLYMDRLAEVEGSLKWTNSLVNQGDFELGVGCTGTQIEVETDGGTGQSYLARQGEVTVDLRSWNPKHVNGWSQCQDVYVGPVTDTVNSNVETTVTLKLTFEGKSRIEPVNA